MQCNNEIFFCHTAPKLFITKTEGVSPKLIVKEAKLYIMCCLLKPEALLKINQRLSSTQIQLHHTGDIVKFYR